MRGRRPDTAPQDAAPTAPRGALSRLPGDPVSMRGHNQGPPLDPGHSWRRHAWGVARAALVPRLPVEVVRRRVARARDLGLAYPAYAAILLGTGRDIVGFLFTCDAIADRLARGGGLPGPVAAKLGALRDCAPLLLTPPGAVLAPEVTARFRAWGPEPQPPSLAGGRAAIRALLGPLGLPGDGVVMVGTRAQERDWAEAARLARFLAAPVYFAGT